MNEIAKNHTNGNRHLQDRARHIVDWLLTVEHLAAGRTVVLLDHFAHRLRDAGLPLDRASLHIQQLHPQLAARSFIWELGSEGAKEMGFEHSSRDERAYVASPVRPIFLGGDSIRRRLAARDVSHDFPILDDLARQGFKDYVILPMPFAHKVTNALGLATKRESGFTDDDLALIDLVLPAFATLMELQNTRRTARDLLNTYVGPNTGERIFSGAIKRGDGEVIHAILWYCDMRNFTRLSNNLPLGKVIELLNTYFDCMAGPVTAHGGEVMKFIGDAMLAIFPCQAGRETDCNALDSAIRAAREAHAGLAALNTVRKTLGKPGLECGISVHIGEVMYGNIGAADRLDFTVIGPAVNLVCRIERLCATLACPILASKEIAQLSPGLFSSRGHFELKGLDDTREVFALCDIALPDYA